MPPLIIKIGQDGPARWPSRLPAPHDNLAVDSACCGCRSRPLPKRNAPLLRLRCPPRPQSLHLSTRVQVDKRHAPHTIHEERMLFFLDHFVAITCNYTFKQIRPVCNSIYLYTYFISALNHTRWRRPGLNMSLRLPIANCHDRATCIF